MKKKIELLFFIKKIKSYASYIVIVFITLLGTAFLGLLIPLINKAIMDKGILMKDYPYLKRMILLFLCIYFFKCLIEILNSYFIARLNAEYRLQLFNETYQHLLKLPMRYFEKNDITKIYNNMNADINAVSKISDGSLFNVFSQLIYFVGGIVCLFHINIQLAIVGLISIPLKYSITAFFSEKNKKLMQKYISINSQFANWFQDSIAGIRELKIYRLFKRKNSELQQI